MGLCVHKGKGAGEYQPKADPVLRYSEGEAVGVPEILLQSVLSRPRKMRVGVELAYVSGRDTLLISHRVTEGNDGSLLCAGTGSIMVPDSITEVATIVSSHTERLIRVSLSSYAPDMESPF